MATIECNNTQTSFNNASSQENGEALPEEKSLSIDYSEDLWLANSEDSSGPYAQHSGKATVQDAPAGSPAPGHSSFPNSISSHSGDQPMEGTTGGSFQVSQHHWGEMGQNEEEGATVLQPNATTFLNGTVEQNGMEFHGSSGDEKDFAQLVPAGTYVETGDAQNKTYTAMMPAAGLGVNGEELQPGFTSMLNAAGQQQMVFYGSGEDINSESSHMIGQQTISYNPSSSQMTAVDSQDGSTASGEDGAGEGNLYVAMDTTDNQATPGGEQTQPPQQQFAVMSPAVMNNQVVEETPKNESQPGYATSTVSGSQQTISTLPFLQNGAFPAPQSSFTSFSQSSGTAPNGNQQQQQAEASQSADPAQGGAEYSETVEGEEYEQDDENSNSRETYSICQETYNEQAGMEGNEENNCQNKSFVCETCHKSFATGRYLKYHRKNHCKRAGSYEGRSEQEEAGGLEVKRFACNICQRPFRVLKCMKVHKKKKHGIIKDFTCPTCAISFNSAQELTEHNCQPKTPPPTIEQPIMVEPIHPPSAQFLSQRKKKKLRQVKPSCDICGKVFGDRISLDIHRVKHIEEEFYPCDMCPLDIHAEDSTHVAVHFRIKFFTDDNQHILEDQKAAVEAMRGEEGMLSPLPPHLAAHHSAHHSATSNATFVSPSPAHLPGASSTPIYSNPSSIIARAAACTNIINHTQDGEGGFVDEAGNYTQAEYSNIKLEDGLSHDSATAVNAGHSVILAADGTTHETSGNFYTEYNEGGEASQVKQQNDGIPVTKTILKSKPHMCDICNKSFTEAAKLEIHYQSNHVEDRPFQCEICDKSFFTKWKLQRHMLSHLEIKPHSCPACEKSFVERGKLEAHYRTHLGTKPYKCEYCSKAFTVKSQLTIHVRRIHSADQPFGCEICGKAFLWRSGLEKHMRKHTREKPYACSFCSQKYSQKSNLISHLAKVHNHQYVEPEPTQQEQQQEVQVQVQVQQVPQQQEVQQQQQQQQVTVIQQQQVQQQQQQQQQQYQEVQEGQEQ